MVLKPVYDGKMQMLRVGEAALRAAHMAVNDRTMALVSTLLENGMSINKNTLMLFNRLTLQNPGASMADLIKLTKLQLPVNENTLSQLQHYENMEHKLLEYLNRFYDRQFITRHRVNSSVVNTFERSLREYFTIGKTRDCLPSVAYFADEANLTPGYFGDLVKKETGVTAQELISRHVVDVAKHLLATGSDDIAEIAYDLGFQYPQHFTRLFKRIAGVSPSQFRQASSN